MSSLSDKEESYAERVSRHKSEEKELEFKIRAMLKAAKKSEKIIVESQAIQMRFDLRARQNEELESFGDIGINEFYPPKMLVICNII